MDQIRSKETMSNPVEETFKTLAMDGPDIHSDQNLNPDDRKTKLIDNLIMDTIKNEDSSQPNITISDIFDTSNVDKVAQILPNNIKMEVDEDSALHVSENLPSLDNVSDIKIEESVITNEICQGLVSTSTMGGDISPKTVMANKLERKRLGTINTIQKNVMLDFMEKHHNLRNGKFSSTFQIKAAKNLWITLTDELNALPGARKDWKHWRKSSILISHPVGTSRREGRVWDKKDRCPYCAEDLTNFSRHLFRKHKNEESVSKILEYPSGSNERKKFINLLRKQGNLSVYSENVIRPVQRPSSDANKSFTVSEDYLPCIYCTGWYKKKSLSRHAKRCYFNDRKASRIRFASEGQTMVALTESRKHFLNRLRLKTEVFNTMHADTISFIGKNDPIICQYAEDYLRKHKSPHIKHLVSNKIRELGRLLIPLQQHHKVNSMLEALKPENFDKVVSAARIISGFDYETKSFKSPSLAMHLRTALLAVCCSARMLLFKKDPVLPVTDYDKVLSELQKFEELVAANWKFEMGSLALKNLNGKNKEHEGKTLEEIDSHLRTWGNDEGLEATHERAEREHGMRVPHGEVGRGISEPTSVESIEGICGRNKHQGNIRCRGSWSIPQKNIMLRFFRNQIQNKISPKKAECLQLQQKHLELFKDKTWVQIKVFVYNTYKNY